VVILALAGLVDAFYFTFAYYGRIRKARWVPEILCAREGSSCVTVVQTPYARVFGVPNSLLGIFYYVSLFAWVMVGRDVGISFDGFMVSLVWLLIAVSAVTVILGFYLIYALRRKLHTDCPMCYAAHAINAALLVLLIWFAR
jgi:uncharacterized membrane protein